MVLAESGCRLCISMHRHTASETSLRLSKVPLRGSLQGFIMGKPHPKTLNPKTLNPIAFGVFKRSGRRKKYSCNKEPSEWCYWFLVYLWGPVYKGDVLFRGA